METYIFDSAMFRSNDVFHLLILSFDKVRIEFFSDVSIFVNLLFSAMTIAFPSTQLFLIKHSQKINMLKSFCSSYVNLSVVLLVCCVIKLYQ